ncbi:MAG: zinc metallopeptidase [Candidatus Stygibacter frigidus]|nr:zinc metallopeptidase [Candidatus Stygibacter frigidus]
MFFDPTLILVIIALIFAMLAQQQVMGKYKKFAKIPNSMGLTGAQMARRMLDDNGLEDINIKPIKGTLTDNYHPLKKIIFLSEGVYNSASIAAIAIAAHETGHAIQYAADYIPVKIRGGLVPTANIGSTMAFPMFLLGFLFSIPFLMDLGIWFFGAALVFHLVTLPVEFNASARAIQYLKLNYISEQKEIQGTRSVLQAAALTYVASTMMALAQFLRLIILRGSRD